jgi:cardiolipin synthase
MAPVYDLMSSAARSLDMTMYEFDDPTAEQILVSDAHRGVAVRVLLDEDYEGRSVNRVTDEELQAGGVAVRWANDSEIFHQKTITVDVATSVIMTANLTSRYYPTTRDLIVIDHEPEDVSAIEQVFDEDFAGGAPSVAPAGQDLVWSPGSQQALSALITSATRSIICENEEMDSSFIESALEADARRAVDVTVVMTADTSYDAAFSALRAAGVHVVLYPDTSSGLYIHAKAIVVDGTRAFVGSENFSAASMDHNRELGIVTSSAAVLDPLNSVLDSDATGQASP